MITVDPETAQVVNQYVGRLGVVGTLIVGLSAGIVAKILMPKKATGFISVSLLGIGGATAASFIARQAHFAPHYDARGILTGLAGAFVFLIAYRVILCRNS